MRWVFMRLSQHYLDNQPTFKYYSATELNEEINRSDLYVHAADVEIEGISCLEAISGGLVPLIARAEKSATKQFIIDQRCGFQAGSAKDLSQKIDFFIENTDQKKQISRSYLKYVRQFKLEYATIKMEEMLAYAIKQTSQRRP